MEDKVIWTIGHSTRSFSEFLELLQHNSIKLLVDVRSLPGSRKFPQFNKENLENELPANGIKYQHMIALGGRRKVHKDSKNTAWRNSSFQGYADYMESEEFMEALNQLEEMSASESTCFMCSEAVWWRCHRSMISDALKLDGWEVQHILSLKKLEEHPYTSPATICNGQLIYHSQNK
jgi:uncharacterized protein (DUF488 family)